MANYVIRKITISNLKDIDNNNLSPRIYNLDESDDEVKLYQQHVAYISNGSSVKQRSAKRDESTEIFHKSSF